MSRSDSEPVDLSLTARPGFDEDDAFLCAAKGLPYTFEEWTSEVERLEAALTDAVERARRASAAGVCLPRRFDHV